MVTLQNGLAPQTGLKESTSEEQLDHVLKRLRHSLPKDAGSLRFMRDMKVFDGDKIYILKPLSRRYWTKTSAMNDADEIAGSILGSITRRNRWA
ncbi:MAG: hypothetical protein ABSH35_02375 [Isosphaeraceae bacterium]